MKHIKIFEDFSGVGGPGGRPGGARLMPGMRGTVPTPNFGGGSGFVALTAFGDSAWNISNLKDQNELIELTDAIQNSITGPGMGEPLIKTLPISGSKYVATYDGEDFDQYDTPADVPSYEFMIDKNGDFIDDSNDGEGYVWEIPEVGTTLVGQPGGHFIQMTNQEFINMVK
jgi:hypothetical protein